jgi:hypothetical protein
VHRIFGLLENPASNVSLATRRLYSSTLREDEVDEIVDLCVGIEALVSDSSPGDTTYKMALRTAAVLAQTEGVILGSEAIFRCMKSIYGYRSALVHGSSDAAKKSMVKIGDGEVKATTVARQFLQQMLYFSPRPGA